MICNMIKNGDIVQLIPDTEKTNYLLNSPLRLGDLGIVFIPHLWTDNSLVLFISIDIPANIFSKIDIYNTSSSFIIDLIDAKYRWWCYPRQLKKVTHLNKFDPEALLGLLTI